jgi:hypothetical protein
MQNYKIPYEKLDKCFTAPKVISSFFTYKKGNRVPRKFKKKWKHILDFKFNDLNQNLWYILEYTNPNYKRFLIKRICNAQ